MKSVWWFLFAVTSRLRYSVFESLNHRKNKFYHQGKSTVKLIVTVVSRLHYGGFDNLNHWISNGFTWSEALTKRSQKACAAT